MQRLNQIDILRAIAVFLVMGRHLVPCPPETSSSFSELTRILIQGGWVGVDLFFVLSGFLVSGLLFQEHAKYGRIRPGRFLIRRGFKIYPSFWILILATIVAMPFAKEELYGKRVVAELLFIQNYFQGIWSHTWSLAVEEHFYLLLALGFLLLSRSRKSDPFSGIPWIFCILAVGCLALRLHQGEQEPFQGKVHLFPSHLRMDSLFAGVLLAYYYHRQKIRVLDFARRFRLPLLIAGCLALGQAFWIPLETGTYMRTYGLTSLYLGSFALLIAFLGFDEASSHAGKALAMIGAHSYSIYLWHMPVIAIAPALARKIGGTSGWWPLFAILYIMGSIATGIVLAKIIEIPALRVRDRYFPSRSNSVASGSLENPALPDGSSTVAN